MHADSIYNYDSTCSLLAEALRDTEVELQLSERNKELRTKYGDQLRVCEGNIAICNDILERVKPLIGDTQSYLNERRTESMQNINTALRVAGEIIPDSMAGIYLKQDGDEAWLSTPDDLTVQNTEGGGYRQVSSAFLRNIVASANPNALRTFMLDEAFCLVSVENTSVLSLYLNLLVQDSQVICIEQKPEIQDNISSVVYDFKKGDPYAVVEKRVIVRKGDNIESEVS